MALKVTTQRGDFIGSYDDVTNRIIEWFDSGAADGFILTMQVSGQGFDDFSAEILPRLEERGYFDRKLHHNTLRENLGLSIPSNRYAEKQQIVAA